MTASISVDLVRCTGHGICALLLSDRVALDVWGFPVISDTALPDRRSTKRAHRAARACPRRALVVNDDAADAGRSTVER